MKTLYTTLLLSLLLVWSTQSPAQSWKKEVKKFQKDLNAHYKDAESSPLNPKDRQTFKRLEFYSINKSQRFSARIERTPAELPFKMATVSGKTKTYRQFALLHFSYEGEDQQLAAYRRIKEDGSPGDYLFIPFKDATSGNSSYGGGRYIDLAVPGTEDGELTLDFNQAYNPYCAYSTGWSCPIPPKVNTLPFRVEAGVMAWKAGHH